MGFIVVHWRYNTEYSTPLLDLKTEESNVNYRLHCSSELNNDKYFISKWDDTTLQLFVTVDMRNRMIRLQLSRTHNFVFLLFSRWSEKVIFLVSLIHKNCQHPIIFSLLYTNAGRRSIDPVTACAEPDTNVLSSTSGQLTSARAVQYLMKKLHRLQCVELCLCFEKENAFILHRSCLVEKIVYLALDPMQGKHLRRLLLIACKDEESRRYDGSVPFKSPSVDSPY